MELLRNFKNIGKSDVALAGGKGASLGEMTKVGILVPDGFVILSTAFENFLEETDLNVEIDSILDSVNHKEVHTIENASEKIEALILQGEIPRDIAAEIQKFFKNLNSKYVAVRSSATAEDSASAAWAGQLESYLNTTEEVLLENVKKCWASLFTPRAIFYRFEKDLHKQKISVAVVVQKMIESEKSGIAFSVHPVTQDRNQLIIEAGLGLGEAIVSGQITPDSYVVEKQPRRIIDKNVQTQARGLYRAENHGNIWRDISKEKGGEQVLSDEEILELSEIILKIESHYNFPCDIEWAFENGKFYIVQSRPITTIKEKSEAEIIVGLLKKHNWVWRWSGNWPLLDGVIQRDNDFYKELKRIAGGTTLECNIDFYEGPILTTYHSQQEYDRIHKAIREKFEEDHSFLIKSFRDFDKRTQRDLKTLEEIATKFEKNKRLHSKKLANLFESSRKPWAHNAAMDLYCLYCEESVLPILKQFLEKKLSTINKKDKIISYLTKLTTPIKPTQFLFERKSFFEILDIIRSGSSFKKYLGSEKQFEKYTKSNNQFEQLLADYLKKYDWLPILVNNPPMSFSNLCIELRSYLLKDLEDYEAEIRSVLDILDGKIKKEAENIIAELKPDRKIKLLILGFQEMAYVRTQTGVVISRSAYLMIPLYTEVSKRLGTTYHNLKFLLPESIVQLLKEGKSAKNLVRKHAPLTVYINDKEKRHVLTGNDASQIKKWLLSQLDHHISSEELKGVSANIGIKQGMVRIVLNSKEINRVKDGDILVAPATSVDFVPAMRKSAAIITETGGITSHAAIVSRELGVPCIVGVKQATKILKDGDMVEVDANIGVIKILK